MGSRWTRGARRSFGRGVTLGWVWGGSGPGWVQGMVLVQNGLGITGPSWVQGMVLVSGSSRWLWSRQGMVLVPVQGMVLVWTGFGEHFRSRMGPGAGSGPRWI